VAYACSASAAGSSHVRALPGAVAGARGQLAHAAAE
jgi:hypothetical protein